MEQNKQPKPMKKIIIVVMLTVALTSAAFFLYINKVNQVDEPIESVEKLTLAPVVEDLLAQKQQMIEVLVKEPLFIDALKKSNEENSKLSEKEILALDQRWRETEGVDEFIQSFLSNDAARALIHFQLENAGFPEIFITDRVGLNIGQTNKTTDYYQADEDWWIDTYNDGMGAASHGAIEFDESSQSEAISVYVPIKDPETGEVIGIAKAVIEMLNIKMSL